MSVEKGLSAVQSAIKNVAIGFGIFILTCFVAVYGMNTFIDQPHYDDFCEDLSPSAIEVGEDPKVRDNTCYDEYDVARENYSKWIFIVSIPVGLAIIALGTFVFSLSSVGVGIMLGGVYTLIYGTAHYWRYGADWMRFIVSLIGLVALVLIAYRFNNPRKKRK